MPTEQTELFAEVVEDARQARKARRVSRVPVLQGPPHPPLRREDRALLRVVTDWRRGALEGEPPHLRCMMVCAGLQGWLSFSLQLQTELVEVDFRHNKIQINHVFLRREDGTIIDPTGDQFNDWGAEMPPVYIGPMPEIYRRWLVRRKGKNV